MDRWRTAQAKKRKLYTYVNPNRYSKAPRPGDEKREAFYRLLEECTIRGFLNTDRNLRMSDKYLLAMVYVYFQRANLQVSEYTCVNFYCALFLANQMEEEDWFYFKMYADIAIHIKLEDFETEKYNLWKRMDYRAFVSLEELQEVMRDDHHYIWKRERRTPVIRIYQRKHRFFQSVIRK